jgi:WD40 repeat protein
VKLVARPIPIDSATRATKRLGFAVRGGLNAFLPGEQSALRVQDNGARLFDLTTGTVTELAKQSFDHPTAVAVSSDGNAAAIGEYSGWVTVLDLATHKRVARFRAAPKAIIYRVAIIDTSHVFALHRQGRSWGAVVVWNVAKKQKVHVIAPRWATDFALDPHTQTVATVSEPEGVQLWRPPYKQPRNLAFVPKTRGVRVAFSPAGDSLLVGDEKRLVLFDTATGRARAKLPQIGTFNDPNYPAHDPWALRPISDTDALFTWEAWNGDDSDRRVQHVELWNLVTKKRLAKLERTVDTAKGNLFMDSATAIGAASVMMNRELVVRVV